MTKLFTSKPKEVFAFRYGTDEEPSWFRDALAFRWLFKTEHGTVITFDLRGMQEAYKGDWIIKEHSDGDIKFMHPKEFERDYEER